MLFFVIDFVEIFQISGFLALKMLKLR